MISLVAECRPILPGEMRWSNGYHLFSALSTLARNTPLEEVFHGEDGIKPFSLSRIEPCFQSRNETSPSDGNFRIAAGDSCFFRICFADDASGELFASLYRRALLRVGTMRLEIACLYMPGEHPMALHCGVSDLAPQNSAVKVVFSFISPGGFKSNDSQVIFPFPGLLFGSLLQKWNVWTGQDYSKFPATAFECIQTLSYRLETRAVDLKHSVHRGFIGETVYLLQCKEIDEDTAWSATMLSRFAFFSGIGVKTSQGMGQVWTEEMD